MQRQLQKAQKEGKAARAELKCAQATAAGFECSFLAERQQRRKVSPCCACHRSLPANCMRVDARCNVLGWHESFEI